MNFYEAYDWGTDLIEFDSSVLTADGTSHKILGLLFLVYEYNGQKKIVPTMVAPIVMKKPIFGIDFQRLFGIELAFREVNTIEMNPVKVENVITPHVLSPDQSNILETVVRKLPAISDEGFLNRTDRIIHRIDTGNAKPVYQKPYIFSPKLQQQIREEIFRLLNRGIIKKIPSSSWLNAVIPVPKPNGDVRLCIDARKLNAITKKNRYSQMNLERIFARISKAKYFSSIDLKDAFYQIPLADEDQQKTAFSIHGLGIFAYTRMPMGLVNSAATLCRIVESVFDVDTEPKIFAYIDDFIVCSDTFERHIQLLQIVADKLKQAGLAIGINKSKFCMKRLKFLGHMISEDGISIDDSRTHAVTMYKKPTNVREVQSFLGFVGWHRKFIDKYAEIAAPLTNLTKKKSKEFVWREEHDEAFAKLKEALTSAPVLSNPDYGKPFYIDSNSSERAVSGILYQKYDDRKRVIAYMSAKLNELQIKYHPVEKECLAVILAFEKFRHYIQGTKVLVNTDHNSLLWLKNCQDPTGRIARWALRLQAYDFDINYKKFSQNEPVCVLSREIDIENTPYVDFESFDCELLSLSEAILRENHHKVEELDVTHSIDAFEINVIEVSTPDVVNDLWYKERYEATVAGKDSDFYKIKNGLLYHRFDKLKKLFENEWKLCIPVEDRENVLYEEHDCVLASHPGLFKTIRRIQLIYYWPGMLKDIHRHVDKCEICRTTKSTNSNNNTLMGKRRETDFPFRVLASDFVGPMTMSKKQNQYLFVVIDLFTKFVWLKPLRTAKTEHIVKFIEDEIFLKYGVCERFICDNGVQFASNDFKDFMTRYSVQIDFTPFYYPQANPCEIANKTIVNAIRSYVSEKPDQRTWDADLSALTCAINNHAHVATDISPYFSIHAHIMVLKGTDYVALIDSNAESSNNAQGEMVDKHSVVWQSVREHLLKAFNRVMKINNKKAGNKPFDLSKDTYLRNQKLSNASERYSKKLGLKYIPVDIIEQVGTNTFIVADKKGKILGKYHSSLLMQR